MDVSSLVGEEVQCIWAYPDIAVHPAWINALTTPVATTAAFLVLADGRQLISVAPCEVAMPERYPALGLALERCGRESIRLVRPDGSVIDAAPLAAAAKLVPFTIASVETSDPLEEGAVSQLSLTGSESQLITFRHIMPPMTLGVLIESSSLAPNKSLERTRDA